MVHASRVEEGAWLTPYEYDDSDEEDSTVTEMYWMKLTMRMGTTSMRHDDEEFAVHMQNVLGYGLAQARNNPCIRGCMYLACRYTVDKSGYNA
jgi:hypothetical protein